MKKLLLSLLILATVFVGCDRDEHLISLPADPELYFSRVRYNSMQYENRTDTIWTIKIVGEDMRRTYEQLNGTVYDDHYPHWIEIGRLWEKKR